MRWLLEEHPELFAGVEAVVNEGGANRKIAGRLLWWGIEVAQKRPLWLEVEATGRAGHASALQPWSAAHDLVRGLARLLALPPVWRVCRAGARLPARRGAAPQPALAASLHRTSTRSSRRRARARV